MTYVFVKNDTILKCSLGGVREMTHRHTDGGVTAINKILALVTNCPVM